MMEENRNLSKDRGLHHGRPRTMKALRKLRRGIGNMEIVDVPRPSPREGEVIVEVKRAGICGTDIHIFMTFIQRRSLLSLQAMSSLA